MSDPAGYNGSTIVDYDTFMGNQKPEEPEEIDWANIPSGPRAPVTHADVDRLQARIDFLEQHNQELSAALVQEKKLVRRYRREAV